MLVSFNWLKEHAKLSEAVKPEEVASTLNMNVVEVEKTILTGAGLVGVVAAKVLRADKHPNADKLKVCQVDAGSERLTVVCGGSNVKEGMLVALAKVGAKVRWHGEGEPVELKPAAIRGVESSGMICASTEIGLADRFPLQEEKEILDLTFTKAKPGKHVAEALGLNDAIFEIDNKSLSHRPDLWGHYGLAREIAVLFNKELRKYKTEKIKKGKGAVLNVKVEDAGLCPRYMGVVVGGVKVGESPDWLKQKLSAVGVRPINNIVDATNFVMMDLGQPLHAFSAEALSQNSKVKSQKLIVVRRAKIGEKILALDGKEYELDENILVIADEDKPLAIAGIMGGEESAVKAETETIILESANFNSAVIRGASARLNLRSESSLRFEKSLDPHGCELALNKAVELISKLSPGAKVISAVADEANFSLSTGPVEVMMRDLDSRLGTKLEEKKVVNILEKLGFGVKKKGAAMLSVTIPSWRATKDISIPEDIYEEVARVVGFNEIISTLPHFPINPPEENTLRRRQRKISSVLAYSLGYTEAYNYSFVSAGQINKFGDKTEKYLELSNPLSKEKPYLRRHLLLNLLENAAAAMRDEEEVKIFEIGKVFKAEHSGAREKTNGDGLLPRQDNILSLLVSVKNNSAPFWEARRALEEIFYALRLNFQVIAPEAKDKILPHEHPERVALAALGGKIVGVFGEIHPLVAEKFELKNRVGFATLNLDALEEAIANNLPAVAYRPVPAFPEVERDIAFFVSSGARHEEILRVIKKTVQLLKSAELFDVYAGREASADKKSLAYRLRFGLNDRTLTASEADKAVLNIILALEEKFGIEIRK